VELVPVVVLEREREERGGREIVWWRALVK
jgi:hypothetical protein